MNTTWPRQPMLIMMVISGRSKDGLYEPALADSEREAVADLLQYLENVRNQGHEQCAKPNQCDRE